MNVTLTISKPATHTSNVVVTEGIVKSNDPHVSKILVSGTGKEIPTWLPLRQMVLPLVLTLIGNQRRNHQPRYKSRLKINTGFRGCGTLFLRT